MYFFSRKNNLIINFYTNITNYIMLNHLPE